MSFVSQHSVITRKIEYARTDGGWRGTFRGPFVISAAHADLESCRSALLAAVDERIIAWLSETPVPHRGVRRKIGRQRARA